MMEIQNLASNLLNGFSDGSTSAFVSNGLLDDRHVPVDADLRQQQHYGQSIEGSDDTLATSEDIFKPTGLLGGSGSTCSKPSEEIVACVPADCISEGDQALHDAVLESQEEILPSLADILGTRAPVASTSYASTSFLFSSICATTYDGKPLYLRKRTKTRITRTKTASEGISGLLEVPIHRLMDQLSTSAIAVLDQPSAGPSRTSSMSSAVSETDLWVDRYRPQRFTELLGDERVHRETLGWLKEWDRCVFGKRNLPGKGRKPAQEDSTYHYEDPYHRPREKILLLSGPPGLGKTTLAHIVARQAGYEVMEINASDSRSGQIVDDRIRPALEAGSTVGSKKPVCLVIDEIDGATGAGDNSSSFVQKLIQLTFDKPYKKTRTGEKKDNKGKRPLLRPLICICNDLYASSLAKLRPHARIIRFTRPSDIHLVKRLRDICDCEGLRADSRALTSLVGLARGDLRGCLNALQFIKGRNQEVTEPIVRTAAAGIKEADATFNSLMSGLFAPLSKKRVKESGMTEEEEGRYVGRLSKDLDASGSLDRIALGCFEHYTTLRQFDATLERFEKATDWLVAFDSMSGAMRSEREYALMPYLSYTIVPFHPLFQERGGGRIERPKADWENHMQTRTNEGIYKSLSQCIRSATTRQAVGLRHLMANEIIQLEFAPYLNRMISPPLRPVNSQVIKPAERATLSRLVAIMVSLELRFVQDKTEEGHLVYRLDPPIDVFITYDGKRATDIAIPRYATRHLVAAEVDAQMIAQQAEAVERTTLKSKSNFFKSTSKISEDIIGDEQVAEGEHNGDEEQAAGELLAASTSDLPLSKKRKAEALLDAADKPPVDFFGRPIIVDSNNKAPKNSKAASAKAKQFRVAYRFKEGNSAAVRKPIKVGAFV